MHAGLLNSLIHNSVQILSLTSIFMSYATTYASIHFSFTSEQTKMNYMLILHRQQPNIIIIQ